MSDLERRANSPFGPVRMLARQEMARRDQEQLAAGDEVIATVTSLTDELAARNAELALLIEEARTAGPH